MDFNSYKKVISNCNHIVKVGMVSAYALFLGVNTALASVTEYMDQKVSLKTQNYTIESVIQQVEKQTDYLFVYDKNDVDVKRTVYVNGSNTDVIELLKGIFDNTDIDCKVLGNNITLSKITNVATRIAQQDKKTAKGNVIDSTGEPVIGASVVEQGTTNGTVTDINGNFTLNLSTPNAKIEISFIGYKTQVLTAQFGKQMAVKLVDDTELLDEVVVVGYGSQKKVNMTGAVATIDSKSLASRPISNISQGLQGLAPGVTVTNAGGQPGQDTGKILIRGLGSFNASSPMVLIDGVEGDMNVVDPSDIESISVLKDASSAAIYGSKAANGVILITTKRGQSGKPNLTYSALFGWSKPADLMDRTTSAELAELTNEAEYWDAISQGASPEQAEKRKPYTQEDIRKYVIDAVLPEELIDDDTKIYINPTGRFVIGGPNGDSGVTGRKIIVDTYGGWARHGGGAFSGKDPTKVDRSAAYAARYVAKNLVAVGLCHKAEIQLSYAIGVASPTSVRIDTFGTGVLPEEKLVDIIQDNFDLRPAGIIQMLDLRRPIYKQTAAYGHFGRNDLDLPWEKLDKVDDLKKYL